MCKKIVCTLISIRRDCLSFCLLLLLSHLLQLPSLSIISIFFPSLRPRHLHFTLSYSSFLSLFCYGFPFISPRLSSAIRYSLHLFLVHIWEHAIWFDPDVRFCVATWWLHLLLITGCGIPCVSCATCQLVHRLTRPSIRPLQWRAIGPLATTWLLECHPCSLVTTFDLRKWYKHMDWVFFFFSLALYDLTSSLLKMWWWKTWPSVFNHSFFKHFMV